MAQTSPSVSWWIVLLPGVLTSIVMILSMWVIVRKRRWRDHKFLARAATMPPEHVASEPRAVKDMTVHEEAFVDSFAIVTSRKGHRVFVAWDATLKDAPADPNDHFAPLRIRRLERGFSVTVRPGDEFRTSTVPWGWYAPVIEIVQASPKQTQSSCPKPF